MGTVLKLTTQAEKVTRTVMDTIVVTPADVKKWKAPPFQRPLKENAKVLELAEELKRNGGVWPGIVTLGIVKGETYLIDGQHRRRAFVISGVAEGYVDVRIHYFNSEAEAGDEFVKLNTQLVRLGPDDILRGLESSLETLRLIRHECPYVGYDSVRRGAASPVVSMSTVLRAWQSSSREVPAHVGTAARDIAAMTTEEDAAAASVFLRTAFTAFGRDPQYYRLWGALNLTLTMWLYRNLVLAPATPTSRSTRFTRELFQKCLMSLSADPVYLDWLVGRNMNERDRAPAYSRIKSIFIRRATAELGHKIKMPTPTWSSQ